jgi:hypothetical protein
MWALLYISCLPAGVAQATAAANAISEALTCGCKEGAAIAQALAQAITDAGGCGCNNIGQAVAGESVWQPLWVE